MQGLVLLIIGGLVPRFSVSVETVFICNGMEILSSLYLRLALPIITLVPLWRCNAYLIRSLSVFSPGQFVKLLR